MEYNASAVKYLFWFVETKETARLLNANSMDEVRRIIIEDNLYQQKSEARLINEFGCIKKRLEALPEELRKMMVTADIRTAKLIAFIGCMASDKLLFDLMYEVYRDKLYMGGASITDADLNIFFKDKRDQNDKVAAISDTSIKKLKQVYCKYMLEAGLLTGKVSEKIIEKPYVEADLRFALQRNAMDKYLAALTGER